MSEKEMRELDIWIGKNVFKAEIISTPHLVGDAYMQTESDKRLMMSPHPVPKYTTDRAAAMEVLEKCAEKCGTIKIVNIGLMWWVNDNQKSCEGKADTLPLAICKFAKELYEKQT